MAQETNRCRHAVYRHVCGRPPSAHCTLVLTPVHCTVPSVPCIGKGKVGRAPPQRRRGAHLPFIAIEPVGG